MSILAILLLGQTASPRAILDRYAQYRKLHPALSADWSLSIEGREQAHGSIMVDGTKRLLYKAEWAKKSYSLSESEKGVVELSPDMTTYEEYPAVPYIAVPPSKLGPAITFLPIPLIRNTAFAPNLEYSIEPSITVAGDKADVVSWTVTIQMMPIKFTVAVDAEGRVVRMTRGNGAAGPGMGSPGRAPAQALKQNLGMEWTIGNYRPISHTSLTAFYTPLPRGFVPYTMPAASEPRIEIDGDFPSVAWKTAASMIELKAAAAGKPEVILITAPDCAPSQKALASLDKIKAAVPGVSFEAVSLARSGNESHGLPYDSTGKASVAIGDTSTPLFVLVDRAGKIKNLWAGFDPDGVFEFEKQINEALKNLSLTKS